MSLAAVTLARMEIVRVAACMDNETGAVQPAQSTGGVSDQRSALAHFMDGLSGLAARPVVVEHAPAPEVTPSLEANVLDAIYDVLAEGGVDAVRRVRICNELIDPVQRLLGTATFAQLVAGTGIDWTFTDHPLADAMRTGPQLARAELQSALERRRDHASELGLVTRERDEAREDLRTVRKLLGGSQEELLETRELLAKYGTALGQIRHVADHAEDASTNYAQSRYYRLRTISALASQTGVASISPVTVSLDLASDAELPGAEDAFAANARAEIEQQEFPEDEGTGGKWAPAPPREIDPAVRESLAGAAKRARESGLIKVVDELDKLNGKFVDGADTAA